MDTTLYICQKHKLSCPQSCWVVGRTTLMFFEGKLQYARTFTTAAAATQRVINNQEWLARKVAEYTALDLPVLEQFGKWECKVWDGSPIS